MSKVFVFHNDGYYEDGGVDFKDFDTIDQANQFINDRMSEDSNRKIQMYRVVLGKELITHTADTVKSNNNPDSNI